MIPRELAIFLLLVLWLAGVISLCGRRDIDVHDKISWLATILILNGFGSLLYFAYGPKRKRCGDHPDQIPSPEARPLENALVYNPILGGNFNGNGQGLNVRMPEESEEGEDDPAEK